jgi:hypothetical protein
LARWKCRLGRIHMAFSLVVVPMFVHDVAHRGIGVDDVGVRGLVMAVVAVFPGYTRRSVRGEQPEQQQAADQYTGPTTACPRSPRGKHSVTP